MTADDLAPGRSGQVLIARLIIGLLQGIVLYLLSDSLQAKAWPSTDGPLFAALLIVAVFVPPIALASLTYLRTSLLLLWVIAAAVMCAGLAVYDIVRDAVTLRQAWQAEAPRNIVSPQLWIALGGGLFIAHCLLVAGAVNRRLIAPYATYFDISWKYGVQIALAVAFTGAFWALLGLGAALFNLINIAALGTLLQKPWFSFPATTLVFACAVHITDVRVGIVRGVRTLGCNLLSWLLPLMTALAIAFLAALPFAGLQQLWNTKVASVILLIAAASLIILINAAYQNGPQTDAVSERKLPLFLRISMAVASVALLPLSLLAAYGVSLRIAQHGWTPDRIIAIACTIVALCYAVGYLASAIRWSSLFAGLEGTNIAVAFIVLAILLALFTPIADPARISVADQVRRLNAGLTTPEAFDYQFLRFGSGRYGIEALRSLAEQQALPVAAERSKAALARDTRNGPPRLTLEQRRTNLVVIYPSDKSLPREFLEASWSAHPLSYMLPKCLTTNIRCDAIIADLDGDGTDEIILLAFADRNASVFRLKPDHMWDYFSVIPNLECDGVREALATGKFAIVTSTTKELEVAGRRLRMNSPSNCSGGQIGGPSRSGK
jgi:hypothetical protein